MGSQVDCPFLFTVNIIINKHMTSKKFIAREWLVLFLSLALGHLIFGFLIILTDKNISSLKEFYDILLDDANINIIRILFTSFLFFYMPVQIIRSVIWAIKTLIKKHGSSN
jgi:hypothetical protein